MKTLIVYSSQTGFTKRYAEWLAEKLSAEIMTFKDAHKKDDNYFDPYDAIIYGGWVAVEKIRNADWFTSRIAKWHSKRLAMFCVGASPAKYSGVVHLLDRSLTDEQKKFAKVFYCEGGLNYDKMPLSSKMLMKTFAAMLNGKKDKSPDDIAMAEHVSKSGDYTDRKYIEPIAAYITQ